MAPGRASPPTKQLHSLAVYSQGRRLQLVALLAVTGGACLEIFTVLLMRKAEAHVEAEAVETHLSLQEGGDANLARDTGCDRVRICVSKYQLLPKKDIR